MMTQIESMSLPFYMLPMLYTAKITMKVMRLLSTILCLLGSFPFGTALSREVTRRDALLSTTAAASSLLLPPLPAHAAEGLASKLSKKDPALLKNSVFNVPPSAQVYPDFMRGATWKVTSSFNGYIFPSTKIDKTRLTQDYDIPGFQKCSIAATCDVGKEQAVYELKIDDKGLQDVPLTLTSQVNAYLGYPAVAQVIYDGARNPNRISIDFVEYKTRNAERIELFCNARESELYEKTDNNEQVFLCSEYFRQVTFSGSANVGIARQVVGNYAHFWTWKKPQDSADKLTGNLLTAAYLDPQDPLFFDEPSKPVAIYSHVLTADRLQ